MSVNSTIPPLKIAWTPRSRMLVCSLAVGEPHVSCMRWMAPTARYYAGRHRMDHLLLPLYHTKLDPSRPTAWSKVIVLNHMLKLYDTVMWLDADTIIVNPGVDIRSELDPLVPVHMVAHRLGRRTIPNTGVWVCRNDPRTFELLEAIWNHTEFVHDGWWEQAALMDLIGYEPRGRVCRFREPTAFTPYVRFLNEKWNSRYAAPASETYILHYSGPDKPLADMERKYKTFIRRIAKL
ncbi:MAG: hypothetical protein K0Q94_2771 [Paenibacillus sp.]|nr:hypothetical protein [Paenibacillus sp.]